MLNKTPQDLVVLKTLRPPRWQKMLIFTKFTVRNECSTEKAKGVSPQKILVRV